MLDGFLEVGTGGGRGVGGVPRQLFCGGTGHPPPPTPHPQEPPRQLLARLAPPPPHPPRHPPTQTRTANPLHQTPNLKLVLLRGRWLEPEALKFRVYGLRGLGFLGFGV